MKVRNECPVCGSKAFKNFDQIPDYFLTKEVFTIDQCEICGFLFTNPYPPKETIGKYYQSDLYLSHPKSAFSFLAIIYNLVKKINIHSKYKSASSKLAPGRVLDIGCGSGDFLYYCKEKGWEIEGIEPHEEARVFVSKMVKKEIYNPDRIIEFPDNHFELITMWHVLEHVDDLDFQLQQVSRVLKKNGRLILALPNYQSYDCLYYKRYWAGWDVPRHLYHFERNTIQRLSKRFGLISEEIIPMRWDSFYVSLLSEKYANHSFSFFRAMLSGFKSNRKAKVSGEYSSLLYVFKLK
ncbi:MAG: hypothetical protein CVT92_01845 [Bacteroidetes bacterium HGW-Bacteroidetes-1]|jgi:SAM-dependent methyltransferase|nr:MAG: hypothetical protein CVT92_01845 [Bacteroidetes bacterium HGW-Bacteroidetes-1]